MEEQTQMDRLWMALSLVLVYADEARVAAARVLARSERAQGTVEYGAALIGVAAAAIALWMLLGPAIGQLGQRMITEVNNVK